MFNPAIYRQADSRWGRLPYPGRGYTMAGSGCGCCAVTHCIIEIEKYKKYTPKNTQPYMKQHATYGHGTTWAGITDGLRHYGYKNIYTPNISGSMKPAWDRLKQGKCVGVLLFRSGSRNGITWTSGGHYIAFTDYKVINGRHYFRLKDSGGRKHDGLFCYETHMAGLLPKIWIASRIEDSYKLTVDGWWGVATTTSLQKALGVKKYGYIKEQPKSVKKHLPNCMDTSWHYVKDKPKGSVTIRALEEMLVKNGAKIPVDGYFGTAAVKALQKFLKVKETGKCDSETVKALQKWINTKVE